MTPRRPARSSSGAAARSASALTPPGPGDRPLFVDEVHARLPSTPDGRPRFSRKWVRQHVAPDAKRYAGRLLYWLERDVIAWERSYFGADERRRERGA